MSTAPFPIPTPRSLPPYLRAGDAHTWIAQTGLPAGFVVFYVLTGVLSGIPTRFYLGGNGAEITTTADPTPAYSGITVDQFGDASFSAASATTKAWKPGRYQWAAFAIDIDGNRTQIASGNVRILADPNGLTPADPRSYNERLLEQIRAVLNEKSLDDVGMYKIGARELTKVPVMELLRWEGLIEARVRKEYIRRGMYVPTRNKGISFGGQW